jgi:hypothetical protein
MEDVIESLEDDYGDMLEEAYEDILVEKFFAEWDALMADERYRNYEVWSDQSVQLSFDI